MEVGLLSREKSDGDSSQRSLQERRSVEEPFWINQYYCVDETCMLLLKGFGRIWRVVVSWRFRYSYKNYLDYSRDVM